MTGEERLINTVGEEKTERLFSFMEDVLAYNEKVNLTAICESEEFIEKHLLDSLSLAALSEFLKADTIIDMGTGGGFPGMPLAICFPEKKFFLADSLRKRIDFINAECEKLGLENVSCAHGRAEDLGHDAKLREGFDLCVSRAVARLSVLAEYCLPFVKPGGSFIAYKGPEPEEEVRDAGRALTLLGGENARIIRAIKDGSHSGMAGGEEQTLSHTLILVKKEKPTPKAYPRKAGTPAKNPL